MKPISAMQFLRHSTASRFGSVPAMATINGLRWSRASISHLRNLPVQFGIRTARRSMTMTNPDIAGLVQRLRVFAPGYATLHKDAAAEAALAEDRAEQWEAERRVIEAARAWRAYEDHSEERLVQAVEALAARQRGEEE